MRDATQPIRLGVNPCPAEMRGFFLPEGMHCGLGVYLPGIAPETKSKEESFGRTPQISAWIISISQTLVPVYSRTLLYNAPHWFFDRPYILVKD